MKHALKPKLPSSSMQLNITLPGAVLKARNLGNSKKSGVHPTKQQPYHIVSSSKQKDMANNRQSCQPTATSCKNRSPTPHPCNRSKADTKEPCQPTCTSCRARSSTPHPHEYGNTCVRTFSQSANKPLQKDNHSFHIDTIQLHQNSPHSTEKSSLHTEN